MSSSVEKLGLNIRAAPLLLFAVQRVFVTGAAGFIGSNLVDRLLADGASVVGWDNLSTGQMRFLDRALLHPKFVFRQGDNVDLSALTRAMEGCDVVFHLAANADVRFGTEDTSKDLQQNTVATFHVLEAMRANAVKRIAFASTGSVYGEATVFPTPEDAPFPIQTSLYGASKLAGEGLIQAYAEGFGFEAYIFRFVSILGERYTHGHVFDFCRQLLDHPDYLRVLGDGTQRKSCLYVHDCIAAMVDVVASETAVTAKHRTQVYNLGRSDYVRISDSIGFISNALGLTPELRYTGGDRGWVGDNPFILLDTSKIQATGWKPKLTIEEGIVKTVRWLQQNDWVYVHRS